MDDLFDLAAQVLTIFAAQLDKWSGPIPWPLWVGVLFLPIVVALRIAVWISRGSSWPVQCRYYYTTQARRDKACRQVVAGEWWYCRHHNRAKLMSNNHMCDPSIRRWQRKTRSGALVDRDDIRGVGFVTLLSNRETLLFYRGVAKRPRDVFGGMARIHQQLLSGFRLLRTMSWRQVFRPSAKGPLGVAERMPRVVRATRISLICFAIALALVVISVVTGHGWRRTAQYASTFAFMLAWNFLRFGVWKDPAAEPRWVRTATKDTVKAIGVLVAVALCGGGLAKVAHGQDPAKAMPAFAPVGRSFSGGREQAIHLGGLELKIPRAGVQ